MEHDLVREFRKELAGIRDKINFLFDRLELAETEASNEKSAKAQNVDNKASLNPEKGIF